MTSFSETRIGVSPLAPGWGPQRAGVLPSLLWSGFFSSQPKQSLLGNSVLLRRGRKPETILRSIKMNDLKEMTWHNSCSQNTENILPWGHWGQPHWTKGFSKLKTGCTPKKDTFLTENVFSFLLVFFFCFWRLGISKNCSGTHSIEQAGLELRDLLVSAFLSGRTEGVCYHTQWEWFSNGSLLSGCVLTQ